jgi:integration host factor subunit beta
MSTVTKKELIDRIADSTRCKRADVKRIVQCFLDHIVEELGRGNRLEFRDFGVFEIKERAARVAQNPKTLQRVPVPAKRTVKFKVGRLLKDQLDHPGAPLTARRAESMTLDGATHDGQAHDGHRPDPRPDAKPSRPHPRPSHKPQIVVHPDVGAVKPRSAKG